MLILHQLHRVPDDKIGTFEAAVRDSLLPSQKEEPARLFWYAEALPDSFGGSEIATMTVIDNPGGLALIGAESGSAVAEVLTELRRLRSGVENRLTRFLTFSPVREELDSGPGWPEEPAMYLHDFVTPQRGHFDDYDRELDTTYRKLLTLDQGPSSKVWAGLQVIPGGGTARECVIISRVADQARFAVPIVRGLPENLPGPLGDWMRIAKKLRDTWTSRLFLAPAWSPLR
jgi:hypothetical protein